MLFPVPESALSVSSLTRLPESCLEFPPWLSEDSVLVAVNERLLLGNDDACAGERLLAAAPIGDATVRGAAAAAAEDDESRLAT